MFKNILRGIIGTRAPAGRKGATVKLPDDMPAKEKREIESVLKKKGWKNDVPRTAQQTIPFERMFPNGICRVRDDYYTKTIAFQDINYQQADKEDQKQIFEGWCGFNNYFDSSVHIEYNFVNQCTDIEGFEKQLNFSTRRDRPEQMKRELTQILKNQFEQGNNGITKTRYITFGIHAENVKQAKPRLTHLQNDIISNFKQIGVEAEVLDGKERLRLMHSIYHINESEPFRFEWKYIIPTGATVYDFIAPTAFAFRSSRTFQMGGMYCAVSYINLLAADVCDEMLKRFLDMDSSQVVTMHMQPVDQAEAVKYVKRKLSDIEKSKIDHQKKAVRDGYDMDIMPADVQIFGKDAQKLLEALESQNERMFLLTFIIMNTGKTPEELENNILQASGVAQTYSCDLRRLDWQQEKALTASLPLGDDMIHTDRIMTTSSFSILIPFTTQELFQKTGNPIYYGINAVSNNIIMADRKFLTAPNGLILGSSGSGKSFSAKREIYFVYLTTDDDIMVCDPESEYSPLVTALGGQVIKISASSRQYINPMDINENYSGDEEGEGDPVKLKAEFIYSLFELIMEKKEGEGLDPKEKSLIDRSVRRVYSEYFQDPRPENMPILEDVYNDLLAQDHPMASSVATALEIYVKGSLNVFNHRTNVDLGNRVVCFDIRELGDSMKKIGMHIVQDQVWGRVTKNRFEGKWTRYYCDEFHLLLKDRMTASFAVQIWKRFRKWGGIPTGITQNVKNCFIYTKMRNVAGLSTTEAQKSSDMLMKCQYMDEITGGKGVVFATGTPVSNSMTELYTLMRYLQYGTLREKGLQHFDCWASTFGETTTAIELAPEGTGYRARTRFAKFFNLPELMNMFKEVADIKTSDLLELPVPKAIFETVVVKPTEIQKEMVKSLSERAAAVHSGRIDPSVDNMLKITSDGRKIGLDQRLMNPLLPDAPESKLNACVNNVFEIWDQGREGKLTQLIFSDLSTPKNDGTFNVYTDIKGKLIAKGVPENEIAFIHDADSETKKKELFSKVRNGQVRILLGSTQKMGAGTNVQDKLIAVHHLDVGWRPSDMTQRNGRIIRQGNTNPEVRVFQYVTEGTFDAYLYQTLENKQKFISQIMTSKSPVRSCEDVDEQVLSYAEVKALCAGNEMIKEKMDLDIDVARLKVLKADHRSRQYKLEDQLLKYFPAEIEKQKTNIEGFRHDLLTAQENPLPKDGFVGMIIGSRFYSEKEEAGKALLEACQFKQGTDREEIGSYRGFDMELSFNVVRQEFEIILRDEMRHRTALGKDVRGNITRLDNTIASIPERLENAENKLSELQTQQESAREESRKPFAQEEELRSKSARLAELDALLNMDEPDHQVLGGVVEDAAYAAGGPVNEEKSSVFNDLEKYGSNLSGSVKIHSRQHAEVL